MADQKLTKILAELVRNNASSSLPSFKQVSGLSNAILSGVGPQQAWDPGKQNNGKDPRGPSFVNRVLDLMSRPEYAILEHAQGAYDRGKDEGVLGTLKEGVNPGGLKDLWRGFSGKAKTTGRDILEDNKIGENLDGFDKGVLGFGIVAADPTTYMGAGLIGKIGKAAKLGTEALKGVEEGTAATAKTLVEQISERAAQQAQKLEVKVPTSSPSFNFIDEVTQQIPLPKLASRAEEAMPSGFKRPFKIVEDAPNAEDPMIAGLKRPLKVDESEGRLGSLTTTPSMRGSLEGLARKYSQEKKAAALGSLEGLPEKAKNIGLVNKLKDLHEQIATAKSPVVKNSLRKEAEKVASGVEPADILSQARKAPPVFPTLTIAPRWVDEARNAAVAFLKNNRLKEINHIGQTNLYNKIVHVASKVRKDRRAFTVFQMLRAAEDVVLSSGRKLTDAEGISVRLSDIANISGGAKSLTPKLVDEFRKAKPNQALEDMKAFTTPQVASDILDPVIKTAKGIVPVLKDLPPSRALPIESNISKELRALAERAGASSREAKTAKKFIDDLFNPNRDQLYSALQQEARSLVRQSSSGILNPKTLSKISDETYKALGANPKVLGRELNQSKVVEGIMTKFATWWGAKDLKPFSRPYIDTARNVAAAFAETMTPLVRKTTATQRATAWSVAAGKLSAGSPEEQALADQFKYMIERLMGTHGIKDNAESVLYRSGTMMKELNDELPKDLKFIDKKGVDDLGRDFNYTNGEWMNSWKEWKGREPAESLYQLTRSLQMVTRKNSMWDDAAARWGMPLKGAEYQHQVMGINRLKGTYFPQQIANQLNNLTKQLERDVFKTPHKSIELFDKVQRMWKTGVTIYSPSHHIRNLNGDVYLAALDGVVSPRPYAIATRVLHAFPTRYKDMESVFNIMDPKLRDAVLRARPGNIVLTTRRGEKMTAEQLYQAAETQGLFIRAMHAEDLVGDSAPAFGTLGSKIQPFGGKVYGAATRASELRDHWVRLAHFTDILSKSNAPLRTAIEQAGMRVKKFHPDGMDLTGFEQNVMRRVIPFYSWMRKATPLVIEGAIMRPHITLAFPKAMANIQLATGIESEGPGDPFPMDQMFPDWLKEKGIGPILQPGSGLGRDQTWRGDSPGYTIVNPTNPFIDQLSQIGSPGKSILSSLSPAARIPIELLTGNTSLGIPLNSVEGGTPGYLAQQIPAVGIGAR